MYIPKKYGQSKIEQCPFCSERAITLNKQKVPVCSKHKGRTLDNLRCVCGKDLAVMHGKYGVFFNCISCGNMNLRKVLEVNTTEKDAGTEESVSPDDPRYF